MIQNITNIKITHKILILTSLLIIAVAGGISFGVYHTVHGSMENDVEHAQNENMGIAATILAREFPGTELEFDPQSGNLERIDVPVVPAFSDYQLIDEVGTLTGETATVFIWDPSEQDYIRKTTNIIRAPLKTA